MEAFIPLAVVAVARLPLSLCDVEEDLVSGLLPVSGREKEDCCFWKKLYSLKKAIEELKNYFSSGSSVIIISFRNSADNSSSKLRNISA